MTQNRVADDIVARFARRNHDLTERFLKGGIDSDDTLRGMQLLAEGHALLEASDGLTYDPTWATTLYRNLNVQEYLIAAWNETFRLGISSLGFFNSCAEMTEALSYDQIRNADAQKRPYLFVLQLETPLKTLQFYCDVLAITQGFRSEGLKVLRQLDEVDVVLNDGLEFVPNSIKLVRIDLRANYDGHTPVSSYQFHTEPNAAWAEALAAAAMFPGWLHTMRSKNWPDQEVPYQPRIGLGGCMFRKPDQKKFFSGLLLEGWKGYHGWDEGWYGRIYIGDCRETSDCLAVPMVETLATLPLT